MRELLDWMEYIDDPRQQSKVRHKLVDIVIIVLFAILANADDWVEIAIFANSHIDYLRKYVDLKNGVPSHDTIQRVMGMISPEVMQKVYDKWFEIVNSDEGEKLKKLISIDGKTMRGNCQNGEKPSHIVSAWCDESGFCMGQESVQEKSNEITAIPDLLDKINIKGQIVTIDAMGTQKDIARKIKKEKKADYVLALKGNQMSLYEDVKDYFSDAELCDKVKDKGGYIRTSEKAHSQIEVREYYQTEDVSWLPQRTEWEGLKSIGMEKKTITRTDGSVSTEHRYYISSLKVDMQVFKRAVRGHWAIESMHWHLDVTFKEDANKTIDKNSAQNLNIIRKLCISILKIVEVLKPKLSLKKKRFVISQNAEKYLEEVLSY